MDDAPTTATSADFWSAQLHGIDTISFKTNIPNADRLSSQFFLGRGFYDGWASLSTKEQTGGVTFGVATDQQYFLTLLGHHVTQIRQSEALSNPTFAVNGNDLRLLRHFTRVNFFWLLLCFSS